MIPDDENATPQAVDPATTGQAPAPADKPTPTTAAPNTGTGPAASRSTATTDIPPGAPGNEDGDEARTVVGDPNAPLTPIGDEEGKVTNTPGGFGTIQREPTPEEMPADAKIAPLAEQVNPGDAQAVGAKPTPETIAGVDQPAEGEKNVVPDATDATQFLPPDSDQHEDAERASEDAARDADRGRL